MAHVAPRPLSAFPRTPWASAGSLEEAGRAKDTRTWLSLLSHGPKCSVLQADDTEPSEAAQAQAGTFLLGEVPWQLIQLGLGFLAHLAAAES